MIEYINTRMNGWAAWSMSGRRNGLGYPGASAFTRLMPRSNAAPFVPYLDEEAEEIDRAVNELEPALREVVRVFYLRPGTAEAKAKELQCCRDTLYARLHVVHVMVMEWLQDHDPRRSDKKSNPRVLTAAPTLS